QLLLGTFATVIGSLLAAHWALLSNWGTRPVEVEHVEAQPLDFQIDLNTATHLELMQLEGIGEMLAERILADREQNGPFDSIDDLRRVKGIGPKTVEKLRPYVRVGKRE
ncbi:MAG: ComEA family DNA-binding protein, partial [Planctomycetaceae bacterium]